MNRIVVIQGGGRPRGNTAQLIDSFKRGAEEAGHSVEVISLLRNEVKGCLGCNACRYGKPCIQKDSFNDLVPKIKEANGVFAIRRKRSGADFATTRVGCRVTTPAQVSRG